MDSDDETSESSSEESTTSKEMERVADKLQLISRNMAKAFPTTRNVPKLKDDSKGTRSLEADDTKAEAIQGDLSETTAEKESHSYVNGGNASPHDASEFGTIAKLGDIRKNNDSSQSHYESKTNKNSSHESGDVNFVLPGPRNRAKELIGSDGNDSSSSSTTSTTSSSSSSDSSSSDSDSESISSNDGTPKTSLTHDGDNVAKSSNLARQEASVYEGGRLQEITAPLTNHHKKSKTMSDEGKRLERQLDFEPYSGDEVDEVDLDGAPLTFKRTQSSGSSSDRRGPGKVNDRQLFQDTDIQGIRNNESPTSRFFASATSQRNKPSSAARPTDQGKSVDDRNQDFVPAVVDLSSENVNKEVECQRNDKTLQNGSHSQRLPRIRSQDTESSTSSDSREPESEFVGQCDSLEVEVAPEVDPLLYAPQTYRKRKPPVVHYFSFRNRPMQSRNQFPISNFFTPPSSLLWNTKFEKFNPFQSEMANHLCHSDDNIVVSAPTGAGKTTVFEMAIARFVTTDLHANHSMGNGSRRQLSKHRKILYVAPSKALCEERYDDWLKRFASLNIGIELALITGDVDAGQYYQDFASAHIVLTTPEKFDGISRKWTEKFFLFASVKLLLVDEVHQLGDKSRGSCLESIIARVKTIQRGARNIRVKQNDINASSYHDTTPQAVSACMRIVAVSATLPNISDVAEFLDANEAYAFDESYRPVPLATHVVGCGHSGKNQFMFWNSLDKRLPEFISKYSDGKQSLIFCHTKKDTEKIARMLAGDINGASTLEACMAKGFAWHHAGLDPNVRKTVELAFVSGRVRTLAATSSLALGVNLPARLVIVKGTRAYRGSGVGYQEVDTAQLLQMVGRAGRPGLDTRGTAVILTDNQSKEHIENILRGFGPAESSLQMKLLEAMNSEISQFVIRSIDDAFNWLKSTFYFVRLAKEPAKYGMIEAPGTSIEAQLLQTIKLAMEQLKEVRALPQDLSNGIFPTAASHIMSQHSTSFETMKAIAGLPFDANRKQILHFLSELESTQYPLRRNEKKHLNECNKLVHYKLGSPPSKFKIQSSNHKTFVLLQAGIGQLFLDDYTLRQEMTSLTDQCSAILTAAQLFSVKGTGHGHVALQCFKIKRSLYACLWGANSGVLNQINGLGQQCTKVLSMNGITTFSDVLSSSDETIGRASGRGLQFASELRAKVSQLLSDRLEICASLVSDESTNKPKGVVCRLKPAKDAPNSNNGESGSGLRYILLAYTDRPGTCLFFQEDIASPGTYRFRCPRKFGKIFIHLVASMIGLDDTVELDGTDDVHVSSFAGSLAETGQTASKMDNRPQKTTKQSQSDIRESFKRVNMAGSKSNPRRAVHRGSKPDSEVRDTIIARTESADTGVSASRNNVNRSRATVSPSPIPLRNPKATRHMLTTKATGNTNFSTPGGLRRVVDDRIHSVGAQKPMMPRASAERENKSPPPAGLLRGPTANTSNQRQYSHNPPVTNSTPNSLKRGYHEQASWHQSRRKQQKFQQRAFTQRQNNPFTAFRHDPNNAETFLDGLSTDTSSVIPCEEQRRLQHNSANTLKPRMAVTNHFHQRSRGRHRGRNIQESEIEILRTKKEELNARAAISSQHLVSSSRAPRPPHQLQSDRYIQYETSDRFNRRSQVYADMGGGTWGMSRSPELYQNLGAYHVSTSPAVGPPPTQTAYFDQMQQYHGAYIPEQSYHNGNQQSLPRSPAGFAPHAFSRNHFDEDFSSFTGYDQQFQDNSFHADWAHDDVTDSNIDGEPGWEYLETDQSIMPHPSATQHVGPIHVNQASSLEFQGMDQRSEDQQFEEAFF